MQSIYARLLLTVGAFAVGGLAGLFLPALLAQLFDYGTGSYEDVLFIWFLTVPGGAALAATLVWRGTRPAADPPEITG